MRPSGVSSEGGGGTSTASASSAVAVASTLSTTDSNSSRRDFFNYAMSLMRYLFSSFKTLNFFSNLAVLPLF